LLRLWVNTSHFEEMMKETSLEGLIAMNWHGQSDYIVRPAVDVMASLDPQQLPTVLLKQLG
jgi:hypothetical protein